jgi:hypothetical protein
MRLPFLPDLIVIPVLAGQSVCHVSEAKAVFR